MAKKLSYFDQCVKAAKKRAADRGHRGAAGGWIYNQTGTALVQGWSSYYREFCLGTEYEVYVAPDPSRQDA